jgi:hypothetical protein
MEKQFMFADFVNDFWVDFTVYDETPGHYNNIGKWIEGEKTPRQTGGIILPLSEDQLQRDVNGTYTQKDRKLYMTEPLNEGQTLEYKGQSYTIERYKDYEAYADVYIYIARGVGE